MPRVMPGYPAMKSEATMKAVRGAGRLERPFADAADLKKTVSNLSAKD